VCQFGHKTTKSSFIEAARPVISRIKRTMQSLRRSFQRTHRFQGTVRNGQRRGHRLCRERDPALEQLLKWIYDRALRI